MNKSTKRIIIWECVVGGSIFLLLLILSFAEIISFLHLFVSSIAIIILGSVAITAVIVLKKNPLMEKTNEKDEIYIKDDEAELIAKQKLYDSDILEYEKELLYKKVGHFGSIGNEVPVYIRKMVGLFENSVIGILVNMKTKQTSFKFYDEVEINQTMIDEDLEKEANHLVKSPLPTPKMKVTEEESALTGIKKIIREPIEKEIKKEDEGGLE